MKLKIKPIHDRVVIKPKELESVSKGGIIIPDTVKEKPQMGEIVACGSGRKDEPMTVKVGDHVLFGKMVGSEIEIDGGKYLIMRESDLLAIV